ncbi:hypothetical protein [Salinicoccus sp. Marseille-QA3877]
MKERWKADAKWFEEDARKHPEKYESRDDEVKVTSEEMEKHLQDFINKTQ